MSRPLPIRQDKRYTSSVEEDKVPLLDAVGEEEDYNSVDNEHTGNINDDHRKRKSPKLRIPLLPNSLPTTSFFPKRLRRFYARDDEDEDDMPYGPFRFPSGTEQSFFEKQLADGDEEEIGENVIDEEQGGGAASDVYHGCANSPFTEKVLLLPSSILTILTVCLRRFRSS